MPNYDAGHYFLTALAPICIGSIMVDGQSHLHHQLVRRALAFMPTGERTIASAGKGTDNPFARNSRTHFARFAVLDDVIFNGRVSGDFAAESYDESPQTPARRPFIDPFFNLHGGLRRQRRRGRRVENLFDRALGYDARRAE